MVAALAVLGQGSRHAHLVPGIDRGNERGGRPTYGVVQIARSPLLGTGLDPTWLLNVVLWTAAFTGAAILLFRRDTRRT